MEENEQKLVDGRRLEETLQKAKLLQAGEKMQEKIVGLAMAKTLKMLGLWEE